MHLPEARLGLLIFFFFNFFNFFNELTSDRIPADPNCSVPKLPSGLDRQAWPRQSGTLFLAQKFSVKKPELIVKNKVQK
jgi:hypothetical protein